DGTSLPPLVIFKGKAFFVKWGMNNPLNCQTGRSETGWTNGEIGVAWIKNFDKCTALGASGHARLLLVDGHSSHYTTEFLCYAREHNIHVLCYPSHSTHIYQGLDVSCFRILKWFYSEEREKFERQGNGTVKKEDFLHVYAAAHMRAFTPETIKAAFSKTGVYPFNPNAIKADLLKPSIESSCIGSGLPLAHSQMSTPVRVVLQLLKDAQSHQSSENASLASSRDVSTNPSACASERGSGCSSPIDFVGISETQQLADESLKALKNSSVGFLFSNQPIASSSELPPLQFSPPPPIDDFVKPLLDAMPEMEREHSLQQAIQALQKRQAYQDGQIAGMQSSLLLQETYCEKLRGQLKGKEKKKETGTRLLGDGMPVALSADEFYRAEDLKKWKLANDLRKVENEQIKAQYRLQVAEWEGRKAKVKVDGVKFFEKKPLCGHLKPAFPKPKRIVDLNDDLDGTEFINIHGGDQGNEDDEDDEDE
ncbi:hypothetical protein M0805_005818, partial [Coniferiporia weirii]